MSFIFLNYGVGLGKTKAALDMAKAAGVTRLIVFVPPVLKTMHHWELEAKKWGIDIPMEVHTYFTLQKYGKGDISHLLPNGGEGVAVIFDEAAKLKNSQSQQGMGAFKMVRDNKLAHFYLLSGTPAPNGYIDMCNYAKMTGFVKNKTDFMNRYAITANYRGFPEIVAYRNTSELDAWWHSIADTKPLVIFTSEHDVWVDFPAVLDETYAKKSRVGKVDGERILLDNASKLSHYCRQTVCSTKTRRDWLENLLENTDDNIVVFVGYKRSMADVLEIANRLKKHVYQVDGSEHTLPDDATASTLRNAVIAVNYQSGGAGLNLQYANHAVFYSPTYSYADYIQARGRISRRGQTEPCTFYHLQAEKSIEKDIYECLANKSDFSERLWDKQYKADLEGDLDILTQ